MTTSALLMREIEAMPEETAVEVLDFAKFLRSKQTQAQPMGTPNLTVPSIKDAYGIFKGIDTHFERDEDDRV
jgi:ABC-type glycerol-3-phosphate transport system substrate-binding protein